MRTRLMLIKEINRRIDKARYKFYLVNEEIIFPFYVGKILFNRIDLFLYRLIRSVDTIFSKILPGMAIYMVKRGKHIIQ